LSFCHPISSLLTDLYEAVDIPIVPRIREDIEPQMEPIVDDNQQAGEINTRHASASRELKCQPEDHSAYEKKAIMVEPEWKYTPSITHALENCQMEARCTYMRVGGSWLSATKLRISKPL
jgi:hypothetical protein